LYRSSNDSLQSFEYGQQVPSPVVPCKGVDLVDDEGLQSGEERPVIDIGADEHRFQRFRCGQQHVRPVPPDLLAARLPITTAGSRGDVAPYAGLGHGLATTAEAV
jgi:hypothetical protein